MNASPGWLPTGTRPREVCHLAVIKGARRIVAVSLSFVLLTEKEILPWFVIIHGLISGIAPHMHGLPVRFGHAQLPLLRYTYFVQLQKVGHELAQDCVA